MKSFLFLLAFCSLFFSCYDNDPDVVITNRSAAVTVVFKYSVTPEITLAPGQYTTLKLSECGTGTPVYSPDKKVSFSRFKEEGSGTFKDRPSYTFEAKNYTTETVTLSADGWMDDLTISAGENKTGLLYTSRPNFTAVDTDGFWLYIRYYQENNIFKVSILSGLQE
jgi:hypothetical protein